MQSIQQLYYYFLPSQWWRQNRLRWRGLQLGCLGSCHDTYDKRNWQLPRSQMKQCSCCKLRTRDHLFLLECNARSPRLWTARVVGRSQMNRRTDGWFSLQAVTLADEQASHHGHQQPLVHPSIGQTMKPRRTCTNRFTLMAAKHWSRLK